MELQAKHRQRFHVAAESGKLPLSTLQSSCRVRGCCSNPSLAATAPFNTGIPRLVGSLFNECSLFFSCEEAARVVSLCKGLLASQSLGFWLFSAPFHWLEELGLVASDSSLFGPVGSGAIRFDGHCGQQCGCIVHLPGCQEKGGNFVPLSFSSGVSF